MNKEAVIKALSEPSTYGGLAALALAFGISAEGWEVYSTTLASIFAAVAVFMREKGK